MIIAIAIVAMVLAAILYAVGYNSEVRPITTRRLGYFDDYDCWMTARQSEPPPAVS